MIYENVELHNVAEVHEVAGKEGVRLQRVPESVRIHLNEGAQNRMLSPACAEIRFVSGLPARVVLSSEGKTKVVVFHGVFQVSDMLIISGEKQMVQIMRRPRLEQLDPDFYRDMAFQPNVVRLMLAGDPVRFHGVEGDGVRPPKAEELPKLRYLAYGTSITHGGVATGPHLCYAAQTARRLGADLINLGVGGAAFCEKKLADYIADRDDWHIATLALSVNMVRGFSLEEFYERVSYMVNAVAGADTKRAVACITLYPHFRDFGIPSADEDDVGKAEAFRERLRKAVRDCPHPNVHLIEGPDILTDVTGLTPDLIHPADNGMINMGENLARQLRPLVEGS